MRYNNFAQLINNIERKDNKFVLAVAGANDAHTLSAVMRAYIEQLIQPILIGDSTFILSWLEENGFSASSIEIIDEKNPPDMAIRAVNMVKGHNADGIMKGLIETSQLMHEVLKKENNIRTDRLMSALTIMEFKKYHKLLALTDTGLCMYPTLSEKKAIIENAVEALNKLGISCPKVAVLAAVEHVNPKMPETVDAAELVNMNRDGRISNCIIEGPLSFDIAMDSQAAEIKGVKSIVSGDPDLLVYPNITAGNIAGKTLGYASDGLIATLTLGTSVPIVVSSRSSSIEEKYRCIALAAATKSY